jgi:hypothetical protein
MQDDVEHGRSVVDRRRGVQTAGGAAGILPPMTEPKADRPANRLARESSAYLRQHMHNPVDWHAWGEEAFARARAEDKPLLVSIGYSACHWCHVMERESFEDEATAALMNRAFVNVKVDREERPDVDQLYMDTVVRLTGHGGWPLTVFCTPAGRPFHAGTYYPPEPRHGLPSFRQLLDAVERAWRTQRAEIEASASRILEALRERPHGVATAPPGADSLAACAEQILAGADPRHGGFGKGPKFPTPTNLEALLAAADLLPGGRAADALAHVALTCREMSRRGLYDQLGGGFHRYCVDEHWGVPHFEKMLYDQGQLLRVYAEAWRRTGDPDLVWPIQETGRYLAREMRGPEGAFFASQDADAEGVEGSSYVWNPTEVEAVLGPERARAFCEAYGVRAGGNFEDGASVLWDVARRERAAFAEERARLLEARSRRSQPAIDRKRVLGWNALAVSGLALAGSLLDSEELLGLARGAAEFALARMRDASARPLRVFDDGRARIPAFLDDVAAWLGACLDLHRAGEGAQWLAAARSAADDLVARFFDEEEGDFFLSPVDGERLAQRPRSDHDGATPHSPGLAALGLLRVATLCGDAKGLRIVERVLRSHAFALERVPAAYPTLARAAAASERGLGVAVIVGDPADPHTGALARAARRALAPEEPVLVVREGETPQGVDPTWTQGCVPVAGRAAAYLCRGVTCSLPITDPEALGAPAHRPTATDRLAL